MIDWEGGVSSGALALPLAGPLWEGCSRYLVGNSF